MAAATFAMAQVNFGIKAGVNTFDLHDEILESDLKDFTVAFKEAQYGFHAGVFLRAKIGPVLLQPELVFNSDNVDYSFEKDGVDQTIFNQKYRAIDMPVLAGIKLGPLRILGGPVGHYQLDSVTDFKEEIQSETFSDKVTVGWQIGGGFDLKNVTVDVRYEANSGKLGESLNIGGQSIAFSQNRNRLVASIGYKF